MNKQNNLNVLLDASLSRGCDSLEKDSWVRPFALYMDLQGNLVFSENLDDKQLESDPEVLLADLHIMMHEKAKDKEAVGTAVVCQVKVENPQLNDRLQSALNVSIDYQDGSTFDCFLPFEPLEDKNFSYGEIFSKGGDSEKFNK